MTSFAPPGHSQLRVLEKASKLITSLVVAPTRRSANFIAVYVVGSPKLHPCSCEAFAFLSESSNRVIITGRNLMDGSVPVVPGVKKCSSVHHASAILRENDRLTSEGNASRYHLRGGEPLNPTLQRYKRAVERREDCDDELTLANKKNITITRCEVNITRK